MTENEKIELFDKWYDENYDEWAEGEEGIALREELEQAFKSGIAELEKENEELKEKNKSYEELIDNGSITLVKERLKNYKQLKKAKGIIKKFSEFVNNEVEYDSEHPQEHTDLWNELCEQAEQFLEE